MASDHDTPTETRITVATLLVDLKYIRSKLDELCGHGIERDSRLDRIERVTWAVSAVASLIAAIFVPIAVAAIKKWLGL
jgi:hypothetical protein